MSPAKNVRFLESFEVCPCPSGITHPSSSLYDPVCLSMIVRDSQGDRRSLVLELSHHQTEALHLLLTGILQRTDMETHS